jgi:hypothetical protein
MPRRCYALPFILLAGSLGLSLAACLDDSDIDMTAEDAVTPERTPRDEKPITGDEASEADAGLSAPGTDSRDAGPEPHGATSDGGVRGSSLPEPQISPTTPAADTTTSDEIDTVMVEMKYGVGPGGGFTLDVRPVILFKDGTACRDMNFVARHDDVATHRMKYPNAWTRWQVIDGKVALQNGSRWVYLDFQLKYPPLARGYTLNDVYRHLSGGGNTSFGGDVLIVTEATYQLTSGHRFAQGSFAGVLSSSVTSLSVPPDQQGDYEIEGYRITLHYDSGKTVTTSFVFNERDPGIILLSGTSFVSSSM